MSEWPRGCEGLRAGGRHRSLRARWRTASIAAGWPFPSDWATGAVDQVCAALTTGVDLHEPLAELGAERADAGVGLAGALQDLAALHAVTTHPVEHGGLVSADPDAVPARMVRATALGWADIIAEQSVGREVEDELTGLTTVRYLRTRLHEVYRESRAAGRAPGADHTLITVSLDIPDDSWPRMMAMVLVADVLRSVFDSGETVSLLRSSTAAVLTRRGEHLVPRCERARSELADRLDGDPALSSEGSVRVQEEVLPDDHERACELLTALS